MSLVQVLYTSFKLPLKEDLYFTYLSELPLVLQEKNLRFHRWQDQHAHLFGKLLLKKGLELCKCSNEDLHYLKHTKYGKPFLDGSINFNISHSGEYVVCAIASGIDIGIDIEHMKEIELSYFKSIMSENEWVSITQAKNSLKEFYKYWTIKESIAKAIGIGLSIPLKDIIINNPTVCYKRSMWNIKELFFDKDYSCHVAINKSDVRIITKKIEFKKE